MNAIAGSKRAHCQGKKAVISYVGMEKVVDGVIAHLFVCVSHEVAEAGGLPERIALFADFRGLSPCYESLEAIHEEAKLFSIHFSLLFNLRTVHRLSCHFYLCTETASGIAYT